MQFTHDKQFFQDPFMPVVEDSVPIQVGSQFDQP